MKSSLILVLMFAAGVALAETEINERLQSPIIPDMKPINKPVPYEAKTLSNGKLSFVVINTKEDGTKEKCEYVGEKKTKVFNGQTGFEFIPESEHCAPLEQ